MSDVLQLHHKLNRILKPNNSLSKLGPSFWSKPFSKSKSTRAMLSNIKRTSHGHFWNYTENINLPPPDDDPLLFSNQIFEHPEEKNDRLKVKEVSSLTSHTIIKLSQLLTIMILETQGSPINRSKHSRGLQSSMLFKMSALDPVLLHLDWFLNLNPSLRKSLPRVRPCPLAQTPMLKHASFLLVSTSMGRKSKFLYGPGLNTSPCTSDLRILGLLCGQLRTQTVSLNTQS